MLTVSDFHNNYERGDGCWIWQGSAMTAGMGYGRATIDGHRDYAHRWAYRLAHGDPAGKVIRHVCDVPLCVRPEHLVAGTQADNVRDCVERGRNYRGLKRSPLSADDVINIRNAQGTCIDVGNRFGVSSASVSRIRSGKRFAEVQ